MQYIYHYCVKGYNKQGTLIEISGIGNVNVPITDIMVMDKLVEAVNKDNLKDSLIDKEIGFLVSALSLLHVLDDDGNLVR